MQSVSLGLTTRKTGLTHPYTLRTDLQCTDFFLLAMIVLLQVLP